MKRDVRLARVLDPIRDDRGGYRTLFGLCMVLSTLPEPATSISGALALGF